MKSTFLPHFSKKVEHLAGHGLTALKVGCHKVAAQRRKTPLPDVTERH
jgi:hypothetical protein